MSADNFILVTSRKNVGYVVLDNLSASSGYSFPELRRIEPHSVHEDLPSALFAAYELERKGYYEYGVKVDHRLALAKTKPEAAA